MIAIAETTEMNVYQYEQDDWKRLQEETIEEFYSYGILDELGMETFETCYWED